MSNMMFSVDVLFYDTRVIISCCFALLLLGGIILPIAKGRSC